jgi:hypothetical protein
MPGNLKNNLPEKGRECQDFFHFQNKSRALQKTASSEEHKSGASNFHEDNVLRQSQ